MRRLLLTAAAGALCAVPGWSFDFGGSVENKTAGVVSFLKADDSLFTETLTARGWAQWFLGPQSTVVLKGNLADSLSVSFAQGTPVTNAFTLDLDQLTYSTGSFLVGRTDFADFDGSVLATKLDGVKAQFPLKAAGTDLDLKVQAGTSAALFKSGSTIIISKDDFTDRQVDATLLKPETLWASPRAVAYVEANLPRLVPNQSFQAAFAGQLDLRGGTAQDGDAKATAKTAKGAGVSMSYWGLGGSGRVSGPLYWSAATWLGLGGTATAVGSPAKWKNTLIANGFGSAALTWLQPSWRKTIAGLAVQLGSWDDDGAVPDQNAADGANPSPYTGWFGISINESALIFNPQPGNLALLRGFWSVKPFTPADGLLESLQVVATGLTFVRPTSAPVFAGGLKASGKELYLGTEADLTAQWRPGSDAGGSVGLGLFVPNSAALDRGVELKVQLGLNLSF